MPCQVVFRKISCLSLFIPSEVFQELFEGQHNSMTISQGIVPTANIGHWKEGTFFQKQYYSSHVESAEAFPD